MCNKLVAELIMVQDLSNKLKNLTSCPNFQYKEGLVIGQVQPEMLWVYIHVLIVNLRIF